MSVTGITLEELKSALSLRRDVDLRDDLLRDTLNAAEALAERYTRRQFTAMPTVAAAGVGAWHEVTRRTLGQPIVRIPDAHLIDRVQADGRTLTADDWLRWPEDETFTSHIEVLAACRRITVRGRFGLEHAFPRDLRSTILGMAARGYYQGRQAYSDAQTDELGDVQFTRALPADQRMILNLWRILPGYEI